MFLSYLPIIVVHVSAGFAALAIAIYLGRHHTTDEEKHAEAELERQNAIDQRMTHPEPRAPNAPFVLLGTGAPMRPCPPIHFAP